MTAQLDRRRDFISTTHAKSYDVISPTCLGLVGRHALVTGAALEDGVGYATATALARAGASAIVLVDLIKTPEKLLNKLTEATSIDLVCRFGSFDIRVFSYIVQHIRPSPRHSEQVERQIIVKDSSRSF
jgi:tRNA A37 threonylcarbamoyladenosine dehydratase